MYHASDEGIEEIFFQKKDSSQNQITSKYFFMDIFLHFDFKFQYLRIPETIFFENGGQIKGWVFNSRKDATIPILKKRPGKLNNNDILNRFISEKEIEQINEQNKKTRPGYQQLVKQIVNLRKLTSPCVIVRYSTKAVEMFNYQQLQELLQKNPGLIRMLQDFLKGNSQSEHTGRETLYCEYRKDGLNGNESYRFQKKVLQFKDPSLNMTSRSYKPKMDRTTDPDQLQKQEVITLFTHLETARERQVNLVTEDREAYYKLADDALKKKLQGITKVIVDCLNFKLRICAQKVICKFIMNEHRELCFTGINELRVLFRDDDTLSQFGSQMEIELEGYYNFVKNLNNFTKTFTAEHFKLSKTKLIINEKCNGDFCSYVSIDSIQIKEFKKGTINKFKIQPMQIDCKYEHEWVSKLSFQIPYNLIIRAKNDCNEIEAIFRKYKIYPRETVQLIQEKPNDIDNIKFVVDFKKIEHSNVANLYRFSKVCKHCYPIYVLLQKVFENQSMIPSFEPSVRGSQTERQNVNIDTSHLDYNIPTDQSALNILSSDRSLTRKLSRDHILPSPSLHSPKQPTHMKKSSLKIPSKSVAKTRKQVPRVQIDEMNSILPTEYTTERVQTAKGFLSARDNLFKMENSPLKIRSQMSKIKSFKSLNSAGMNPANAAASFRRRSKFGQESQEIVTSRLILGAQLMTVSVQEAEIMEQGGDLYFTPQSRQFSSPKRSGVVRANLFNIPNDSEVNTPIDEYFHKDKPNTFGAALQDIKDQSKSSKRRFLKLASTVRKTVRPDLYSKKKTIYKAVSTFKGRPLIPLTTLFYASQYNELNNMLFDVKRFVQHRKEVKSGREVVSVFHGLNLNKSLRPIPTHQMTSTKKKYKQFCGITEVPKLSIEKLCVLGNYEPIKIPDPRIRIHVIDEQTAIPYSVISSSLEKSHCGDVVIVCHDIFSNYIEQINYYSDLADQMKNIKFILFNIPGQAYTLFNPERTYNNDYNSNFLDVILDTLHQNKEIDFTRDLFKFIGSGFGSNILLNYLSQTGDQLFSKSLVLAINPISEIDPYLQSILERSDEEFKQVPELFPHFAYQYYNLVFGNGKLTEEEAQKMMERNPISTAARSVLIKSVLENITLKNSINNLIAPTIFVQTKENHIVKSDQLFDLFKQNYQLIQMLQSDMIEFMKNPQQTRTYVECKGTFNALEERQPELIQLIEKFIMSGETKSNKFREWMFNERMLAKIQSEINDVNADEIRECDRILEVLCKVRRVSKEGRTNYLAEAEGFLKNLNLRIEQFTEKLTSIDEIMVELKEITEKQVASGYIPKSEYDYLLNKHTTEIQSLKEQIAYIRENKQQPLTLYLRVALRYAKIDDKMGASFNIFVGRVMEKAIEELQNMSTHLTWTPESMASLLSRRGQWLDHVQQIAQDLKGTNRDIVYIDSNIEESKELQYMQDNLDQLKDRSLELEVFYFKLINKLLRYMELLIHFLENSDIGINPREEQINEYLGLYCNELCHFAQVTQCLDKICLEKDDKRSSRFYNALGACNEITKSINERYNNEVMRKSIHIFLDKARELPKKTIHKVSKETIESIEDYIDKCEEELTHFESN